MGAFAQQELANVCAAISKGWGWAGIGRLLHRSAVLAFSLTHESHLSCSAPLHRAQRAVSYAGVSVASGESKGSDCGKDWPHQLGVL